MEIRILSSTDDLKAYDRWVRAHPQGNLWQSVERMKYLKALGKEHRVYAAMKGNEIVASALVMIDKASFGLSTWEVARGPLWSDQKSVNSGQFIDHLRNETKKAGAMSLFLSPYVPLTTDHSSLTPSRRFIHCEATRIIDLRPSEEMILKQMHEKGRYNIRVAQKHGVVVKESTDIDAYYALTAETGGRDGFTVQSKKRYATFLQDLPGAFLLMGHAPSGEAVTGLLGVIWNGLGVYYYGASSSAHRNLMAPYLLQWEAMKRCKAAGCERYDLLGIAPEGAPKDHPWHGITDFKRKFGGEVVTYPAEQEIVLRPFAKAVLGMKRKIFG